MSLSKCMKQAGELLPPEYRRALFDASTTNRAEGMKAREAGIKAVRDVLGETKTKRTEAEKAFSEAGPTVDQSVSGLKVVLPGSDEQISVGEALKRIDMEKQQDEQWADLLKVAIDCALGN